MVVKAKNTRPKVITYWPINGDKPCSNANVVIAAPDVSPLHTPVSTKVRPVIVQIIMVSKKVPVIEISPCFTQESVFAAAAAIGALPKPDSLENTPRATPLWIASITVAPKKPPVAAVGVKALLITKAIASGTASILNNRTNNDANT